MLSSKMFLSHLNQNENSTSNKVKKSSSNSPRAMKKRALQNRPMNNKENAGILAPKNSIKSFFSDVPNANLKAERKRKLVIFEDSNQSAKKSKTIATQTSTSTSPNAIDLICSEEPTPKYWELLAEERRKALDEALVENKELADEIEKKDEIITELKSEVENLEETASQAQYLASVIEELGKDCLDKNEAKESSSSEDEQSSGEDKTEQSLSSTDEEQQPSDSQVTSTDCSATIDSLTTTQEDELSSDDETAGTAPETKFNQEETEESQDGVLEDDLSSEESCELNLKNESESTEEAAV